MAHTLYYVASDGQFLQWTDESEEVGRRAIFCDDRVTTIEKIDEDGSGTPDFALTFGNGDSGTAEVTSIPGDFLDFKETKTLSSNKLEVLWCLRIRVLTTPIASIAIPPITPKALQSVMKMAGFEAIRLEADNGGGRRMLEFQEANPQVEVPWAVEAQAAAHKVRNACFPVEINGFKYEDFRQMGRPQSQIDHLYNRHNPVRVSLSVAQRAVSDWEPGIRSLPVDTISGGQLGRLDEVARAVQGEVKRKGGKKQASYEGVKWLIITCSDLWVVWQLEEAFAGDQQMAEAEVLTPLTALDLSPFEEVWVVAPEDNTGTIATIVKLQRDGSSRSAVTIGTR